MEARLHYPQRIVVRRKSCQKSGQVLVPWVCVQSSLHVPPKPEGSGCTVTLVCTLDGYEPSLRGRGSVENLV